VPTDLDIYTRMMQQYGGPLTTYGQDPAAVMRQFAREELGRNIPKSYKKPEAMARWITKEMGKAQFAGKGAQGTMYFGAGAGTTLENVGRQAQTLRAGSDIGRQLTFEPLYNRAAAVRGERYAQLHRPVPPGKSIVPMSRGVGGPGTHMGTSSHALALRPATPLAEYAGQAAKSPWWKRAPGMLGRGALRAVGPAAAAWGAHEVLDLVGLRGDDEQSDARVQARAMQGMLAGGGAGRRLEEGAMQTLGEQADYLGTSKKLQGELGLAQSIVERRDRVAAAASQIRTELATEFLNRGLV
jgi:hypothetical protein